MNILFLCTANIQRSKTAELLFQQIYQEHSVKSAGLSRKYCERNGSTLCTVELLDWAHVVFVMEHRHIERIHENVGSRYDDKLTNLNIDDVYQFNDAELVQILKENKLISEKLRDN